MNGTAAENNKTVYYAPAPPKPATMLILENGKEVRVVQLNGDMRIGRDAPGYCNDIKLTSGIAGRNHGELIYLDGVYYYRDNNSMNGTYYNGAKLMPYNEKGTKAVPLHDGDVLRIDRVTLDKPHPDAVEMIFSTAFLPDEKWTRFPLNGMQRVSVGRNCGEGISLSDFMVSRNHAVLQRTGAGWKIEDQHSQNGLAVNGEIVTKEYLLHPFDVIRIANTTLIFLGNEVIFNNVSSDLHSRAGFDYNKRSVVMRVNIDEVIARRPGVFTKKKTLLKDISLDIESGDFTLILGGAGAGKSTFIKAITGQQRSSEQILDIRGEIFLDGMDLYRNLRMLKHKIGIVPQYADYRMQDTVYHTIMDAARTKLAGEYSLKEIEQRVEDVIESMTLTQIRDSMLGVISGGQRKRVQVAIHAVGDISFFTYDEPDSGLDVAGRVDQMKQLIKPITKEESVDNSMQLRPCSEIGNAGLMISHYPDDVAHMYKKVIVLAKSRKDDAGHLAFYGDVENALSFFGVKRLSEIVMEINYEGGKGRGDEFIEKFEQTRRG